MRIALLSSCWLATPPRGYGGTELIVGELARGLVARGHDVTLFATGDSTAPGTLRSRFPSARPPGALSDLMHHRFAWDEIARGAFQVIHCHQPMGMALAGELAKKTVYTVHHDATPESIEFYRDFPGVNVVAISHAQARGLAGVEIRKIVHHGLDVRAYSEGGGDGGYVAFLGRYAPEKAPDAAIRAAKLAGVPLRLGGAAHVTTRAYFDALVKPLLGAPDAIDLGELSHEPKVELLRHARALLMPIDWEEPFGLVMIEAMLTGTPVIAFRRGSVSELVEEGVTGFIVENEREMASAIGSLASFDRKRCRERAMQRWSTERMVDEYASLYESLR